MKSAVKPDKKSLLNYFHCIILIALIISVFIACPNPIDKALVTLAEDIIPPNIKILSPGNNSLYKSIISVTGLVEDSAAVERDNQGQVKSVSYAVQDHSQLADVVSIGPDGSFNFDIPTGELYGREVIFISAEDWNGNIAERELTLFEDESGPYLNITLPLNHSIYIDQMTVTGQIGNSDTDQTSITEVESISWIIQSTPTMAETLNFDPSGNGSFTTTPDPASIDFDQATNTFSFNFYTYALAGDQYIMIIAEDWSEHSTEYVLTLHDGNVGPYLDVTSPPNNDKYHAAITVTGILQNSVTDPLRYKLDNLSCDVLGYPGLAAIIDFLPDPDNPTYTPDDGSVSFDIFNNIFSIDLTTAGISEPFLRLSVRALDLGGKFSDETIDLVADFNGPDLDINTPDNGDSYGSSISVSGKVLSWTDAPDATEVSSLEYSIGGLSGSLNFNSITGVISDSINTSSLSGPQTLTITAEDMNQHTSQVSISLKDGLAPDLTITSPLPSDSYGNSVSVNGTVLDFVGASGASDVDSVSYSIGGLSGSLSLNRSTGAISGLINTSTLFGQQDLVITAEDEDENQAQVSVSLSDGIAPNLTITAPSSGDPYGPNVTVDGTVRSNAGVTGAGDVDSISYAIGGLNGTLGLNRSNGAVSGLINTSTLFGPQSLYITAEDDDGNQSQVSISLSDGIAPDLTITAPSSGDPYGPNVTVDGTVRSNAGVIGAGDIKTVSYTIGGLSGTLFFDDSTGEINETIDISYLSGPETLTIIAEDNDGNTSAAVTISMDDGVPPDLSISSPSDGGTYGNSLAVSGTVLDFVGASGAGDVASLTYTFGGPSQQLDFDSDDGTIDTSIDTSSLTESQTLTITAEDDDGNQSQVSLSLDHE